MRFEQQSNNTSGFTFTLLVLSFIVHLCGNILPLFACSRGEIYRLVYKRVFIISADYVQCLTQPMELKYDCPSQSTWKTAASAFLTVLRLGLPIARQQSLHFYHPSTPLNADERKRHEFIDCQIIELIRTEVSSLHFSLF
uniref:Mon2 C-terminal domain-containing protein n=1 Tax=Parascaris equorum TaxID=6256 RepID=A0A914RHU4_PAREQ